MTASRFSFTLAVLFLSVLATSTRAAEPGGAGFPGAAGSRALGQVALSRGDWNAAVAHGTMAITLDPADARGFLLRACAHAERGRSWGSRAEADRVTADATRALELDPALAEAHACLGIAHALRCERERAAECCERAVAKAPDSALAYYARGVAHWWQDDITHAEQDFLAALARSPGFFRASRFLVYVHRYRGERDKALADAEKLVALDLPAGYVARSTLHLDRREYAKALADARKAIELAPADLDAHRVLADVYLYQRDYAKALGVIARELELAPGSAEAHCDRANCRAWMGEPDLALADCRLALRLDPCNLFAHRVAADAFSSKNESGRAVAACNDALRLFPRSAEFFAMRSEARSGRGDEAGAAADLRESLRLEPRLARAIISEAANHYLADRFDEALAAVDRALKVDAEDATALAYRSACLERLGRQEEADRSFAAAAQINRADAHLDRGWARVAAGDKRGGFDDLDRGIRERPDDPTDLLFRAVQHLFADEDVRKATADVELALRLAPGSSYAHYLRAQCHDAEKDTTAAVAALTRAIAIDPEFVAARSIRATLYLEKERYAEALDDCDAALAVDPDDADTLTTRATLFVVLEGQRLQNEGGAGAARVAGAGVAFPRAVITPGGIRIRDAGVPGWLATASQGGPAGVVLVPLQALSPDGRWVACGLRGGAAVTLFDARSGAPARRLPGHAFGTLAVCFSPDGQRLATAGRDGCVRVWDVGTGRELQCLVGDAGEVRALAYSRDGRLLASAHANGADDAVIRVWNCESGEAVREFALAEVPTALAFLPNGDLLSGGERSTLQYWECATGKNLWSGSTPVPANTLAIARDGRHVLVAGERGVSLFALKEKKTVAHCSTDAKIHGASFSADERLAVVLGADGSLKGWQLPLAGEQAVADATRAARLQPEDAAPLVARGMAYFLSDRFGQARADFTRAIERNSKHPEAYFYRALVAIEAGETDVAITDLSAAIDLNPKDGEAHLERGLLLLKKGEYQGAKRDLDRAIELDKKLESRLPVAK